MLKENNAKAAQKLVEKLHKAIAICKTATQIMI